MPALCLSTLSFFRRLSRSRIGSKELIALSLFDHRGEIPVPPGFADNLRGYALLPARRIWRLLDIPTRTRAPRPSIRPGRPASRRGVYFSHRQLVLHTLSTALALSSAKSQGRIHRDDVYMPITPMFHVHAWGLPFVATLLGLKQVYPGRYAPETLLELIRQEKVTLSHGVPTIVGMLLTHPDADKTDLRGWKLIVGGSALPRSLAQEALRRGIDVFVGYGMSENRPGHGRCAD